MDDMWSESGRAPFSSSATDDTSIVPWGSPDVNGGTGPGTPAMNGADGDITLTNVQNQLERRLQGIPNSSNDSEAGSGIGGGEVADDLRVEKDHMEHQLRMVKAQMRRMVDARAFP